MLRVQIHYTVDPRHLDAFKRGASRHLPAISPSLRMEICARALGYNTWAAMQASGRSRRSLEFGEVLNFGASRGITLDPLSVHLAMADATLFRIATLKPELHWDGVHEGYFSPSHEEARAIRASVPAGKFFEEVKKERLSKFEDSRGQLFESNQAPQVLRAMALFSTLAPTKTIGARSPSSYFMKHVAEQIAFDIGDGVVLEPNYVSNADAIVAALDHDFPIKHHGGSSPNVSIGITVASLRVAKEERSPRKRFG